MIVSENDLCVVIKFSSGEQVLAILQSEDENYIQLNHPMTIRTFPVPGESKETVIAAPFCQFSDDYEFTINKKDVLYIKKLNEYLLPHYQNMVEEFSEPQLIRDARIRKQLTDTFDGEEITAKEAVRRIAMLHSIANPEQEEEEPSTGVFVGGNDTIH